MTHRWMKFWPQDWQSDTSLRMCGLAARGLWIECIAIMHRAEPYGHLVINNARPTDKQLAAIVGSTEKEVSRLLAELQEAGVFSVTADGIIVSRRMVRDHAKSEEGREAVGRRWSMKGSDDENAAAPNTPPNRSLNTKPNGGPCSLEAEAESETERDTSLRSVSPAREPRAVPDPKGFEEFWRYYPAKVGKAAARRAFPRAVKQAGGDPDEIVFGLKARLHLFPEDPRFIPHPATWLNQGRWEDDPETLLNRRSEGRH